MNEADHNGRTPDEKRAREAVRRLPGVGADPDFRAALRKQFVSGTIGSADGELPAGSVDPAPGESSGAVRRPAGNLRRRRGLAIAGFVAALAASALVTIWPDRAPLPELVDLVGPGEVQIADRRYDRADLAALGEALEPGATLRTSEEAVLDIRYGDVMLLQYDPGTIATLPDPFDNEARPESRASVEFGEMRIRTGPGFTLSSLAVSTPEGLIRITGTLVSIFRDSTGTCVCVFEGRAMVGRDETTLEGVPAGKRKVMPAGKAPFIDDIAPPHHDHLLEFQNKYGAGF